MVLRRRRAAQWRGPRDEPLPADVALSHDRRRGSTLALTVGCEVGGDAGWSRLSDGFTRPLPSAGAVRGRIRAHRMVLLAKVLEVIPTSIAYTVWTGAGSALIAVLGVALLGEALSARAVGGIVLVVVGVALLNLSDRQPARASVSEGGPALDPAAVPPHPGDRPRHTRRRAARRADPGPAEP